MSKSPKHSTIAGKSEKVKWTHWDDYFNTNLYTYVPISEEGLEILGREFLSWARSDEDALIMEDFFNERGVPDTTLRKWLERSKKFQAVYDAGKRFISSRREKGGLRRGLSEGMITRSMPKYDLTWKELEEWRSSLRTKEQAAGKGDIKVFMEAYPKTDIVPEKKDEQKEDLYSCDSGEE